MKDQATKLCFPLVLFFLAGLVMTACKNEPKQGEEMNEETPKAEITQMPFGKTPDGQDVAIFTLTNKNGVTVKITNYGGIVTSILAPDRAGKMENIVLGFDNLDAYLEGSPYFGAIVGRYGNRIAKGKFVLDGTEYTLATNNFGNHLHGGVKGFDKVVWTAEAMERAAPALKLTYRSVDGEEGYPGNLDCEVVYTLTDDNELKIDYSAKTDKKTIVNLTNHTYFNLVGNATRDILDHVVTIGADRFLPVDETLIPTGELRPVAGTPFDFIEPTTVGARINAENEQIKIGGGYDHCWVLKGAGGGMPLAATVLEPTSGRYLEVFTTEPAIQFYTGNFLDGSLTGPEGTAFNYRYGLCLETEHYPDSPNRPEFPSTELAPGETYQSSTTYKFSTK